MDESLTSLEERSASWAVRFEVMREISTKLRLKSKIGSHELAVVYEGKEITAEEYSALCESEVAKRTGRPELSDAPAVPSGSSRNESSPFAELYPSPTTVVRGSLGRLRSHAQE